MPRLGIWIEYVHWFDFVPISGIAQLMLMTIVMYIETQKAFESVFPYPVEGAVNKCPARYADC